MNTAARLGVYGAGLVLLFGAAFAAAGALIPDEAVTARADDEAASHDMAADEGSAASTAGHEDEGHENPGHVSGVSITQEGFTLGPIASPAEAKQQGTLSFRILNTTGDPVTEFVTAHEKKLHLIIVRTDGSGYRHVHPDLDSATGTWSLPWTWEAAGTYRVYADFVAQGDVAATLSRAVDVRGSFDPAPPVSPTARDSVDGFDVTISGDLVAGAASELTVRVTRDGAGVTDLEPYLGAFGHLIALREGDLAYLHVHAHGAEPEPGAIAGPEVVFTAEAPTAGRYLLFLDFQVDGEVHSARFVLDAAPPVPGASPQGGSGVQDSH